MLTAYLAALAFGLVLIGASAFSGHGDGHDAAGHGDGDGDGDHDGGHGDAEPHGPLLSNLLSLRFWTWALGAFGMTGTALALLGLPPAVHLPASIGTGLTVGAGTAWLFARLRTGAASSPASLDSCLGTEAEVVLPLHPEGLGKVRLRLGEQDVEVPARGGEDDRLDVRTRVVVVRFRDGVAEVRPAPWKD